MVEQERFNPLDPLGLFSGSTAPQLPQTLSLPPTGVSGDFPFRAVFPRGAILYHGTSEEDAHKILRSGFQPAGTFRVGSEPGTLFLAYNVVDTLAFVKSPTPAILRMLVLPDAAEASDCTVEILSKREETQVRVICPEASRLKALQMEIWIVGQ